MSIADRLNRLNYFPQEIRSVISNGVSEKKAEEISSDESKFGLEEGMWSYNLLRYVTNKDTDSAVGLKTLSLYTKAISDLAKRPAAEFVWKIDGEDIWVRLVHNLVTTERKITLSTESHEKIAELYTQFKEAVDTREQKHTENHKELYTLFPRETHQALLDVIVNPISNKVTNKKCAKLLFAVEDQTTREIVVRSYLQGLEKADPKHQLTQSLVKWYEKNLADYPVVLPQDITELAQKVIAKVKVAKQ